MPPVLCHPMSCWSPSRLSPSPHPRALPQGALSTHNLSYWRADQYIGVGPGKGVMGASRGEYVAMCPVNSIVPIHLWLLQGHMGASCCAVKAAAAAKPVSRPWSLLPGCGKCKARDTAPGVGWC